MNKSNIQNKNSKQRISRSMTLSQDKKPKTLNFKQDISRVARQQNTITHQINPKLTKNFSVGSIGTLGMGNNIQKENSKPNLNINSQNNIIMSKKIIKKPADNKQQVKPLIQLILPPNQKTNNLSSKRKNLNENNSISIIEKSKLTTMKSKIEEIFRKFSNLDCKTGGNYEKSVFNANNQNLNNLPTWKKNFRETFEKEKIVDFSSLDFIPRSLNNIGSYVLKLEKFWILWLEIIKKELNLEKIINLFNNALSFMNDDKVLKKHFNFLLADLKIPKKEITDFCKANNITNKVKSIDVGQYDYLLDSGFSFNYKNNISTISEIPVSEKQKKLSPFFGTGSDEGKLQNMKIFSHSNSSSKIIKSFNNSDFSKIDFKENQDSASKNKDLYMLDCSNNKAFSFYDLTQNLSPMPSNDNFSSQNDVNLPLINPKYEASYLTINETLNEETINFVNNKTQQDYTTQSFNSKIENNFTDELSFVIRSPEVSNTSKSNLFYQNVNKSSDSYTEKLRILTEQGKLDTKSIVKDIEKITSTLKKEIDQLRSPNTFQEEIINNDLIKSCCKSYCCVIHKNKSQNELESGITIINDKISGHGNLKLDKNLIFEEISSEDQFKQINSIEMDIPLVKEHSILNNLLEDSNQIIQNHNDSGNIINCHLAAGIEIEIIYSTNKIENHFSKQKITESKNSNIKNSPNNHSAQEVPRDFEDSYEKFLKDTATKRGENINEYISYKNFTPKASLIENVYTNEERRASLNSNENEQFSINISSKYDESNEKVDSKQNNSLCMDDKKEDEEINEIIAKRRRKTTIGVKKRGKSKSKKKTKSRSKSMKKIKIK